MTQSPPTDWQAVAANLAEALEVLLDEACSFSVSGVYFTEPCMSHKGPDMAQKALAEWKASRT